MATAWEMLRNWWQTKWSKPEAPPPPPTEQVENPYRGKIESSVQLDVLDLRGKTYFVKEIREYVRNIGGKDFKFVDYVLLHRPISGEDVWMRLRMVPITNADQGGVDCTHTVIVLSLHDEFAYTDDFLGVVNDGTEFVIQEGDVEARYWRINDVATSYKTAVMAITADKGEEKTTNSAIEYWDYWRETPDETGTNFREFVFVEKDEDNGWFHIWKGAEINPQRVSVM